MLTKKTILRKLREIYKRKAKFCVAIKAVEGVNDDTATNGTELRLVPVIMDTPEQFDYTLRFVKVMTNNDGREVMFGSPCHLIYIAIIHADSEEEGNAKIKAAIAEYSRANGFGKVMLENELTAIASECMGEYNETAQLSEE